MCGGIIYCIVTGRGARRANLCPGSRSVFHRLVAVLCLIFAVLGLGRDIVVGETRAAEDSWAGKLLVATPEMGDPRFAETVIYMVAHDAEGAMGLIVNRPIGTISYAELLAGLGIEPVEIEGATDIHYGGPVDERRGFALHSADFAGVSTLTVNDRMAMSSQIEVVGAIAVGEGPRDALIVFGYAGWGPRQLEGEIEAGGWVVVPSSDALVFGADNETKWNRALASHAVDL